MRAVTLNVNGFDRPFLVDPHEMLLTTIRERIGLTGTKPGCDSGSCGACTVLVDGRPVLGCITPTLRCEGKKIVTIEGVARGEDLHPVQRRLVERGGMQCGYCTPGIVMTSIPFLEENRCPSEADVREALAGNLCRCTGFAKIIEAVRAAGNEESG
ncbi:MAG: (2Fe-2S)-binding protein [Candidatus Eisenbacteria bacterium]